jgi:hypothetical protein
MAVIIEKTNIVFKYGVVSSKKTKTAGSEKFSYIDPLGLTKHQA